jgi:radical SAM protein with 4Fe4S-binding SPASM domain
VLDVATGPNRRLQVVIFSLTDGPFDVDINWLDSIRAAPAKAPVADSPAVTEPLSPAAASAAPPPLPAAAAPGGKEELRRRLGIGGRVASFRAAIRGAVERWLARRFPPGVRYHCQKPWTDLHNFTVDGRMDVCCIATGSSQERYALGNLVEQSFQEVWNGERMREFRRTVNSDQPLPPCRRCPMLYAYQGPLFCPRHTISTFRAFLEMRLRWLPGVGWLSRCGVWLLREVVFRGFRQE